MVEADTPLKTLPALFRSVSNNSQIPVTNTTAYVTPT